MSKTTSAVSRVFSWIKPTHAKGSWIYSNEHPKRFLDFTSGIGALSLGHCHNAVTTKVVDQAITLVHSAQQVYGHHSAVDDLIKNFNYIIPDKNLDNYFFTPSGSEATDNAVKIAKRYTNRQNIVAVKSGFHGRTLGALSLTSSNVFCKNKIGSLLPNVYYSEPNIDSFLEVFEKFCSPDNTAGFIFESVQGEGGIYSLPKEFLKPATDFCKEHGILVIADEIQCGVARTGHMWNVFSKDITPDMMLFGKGIANGYPLAGIVSTTEIMDNIGENLLGGTYGSNAVVCAASSATIQTLLRENILHNVRQKDLYFRKQLSTLAGIKSFRCYGLMIVLEPFDFIDINILLQELAKEGVCVLKCGSRGQYIRIMPPLNVSYSEIDYFIEKYNIVLNKL
jgi:4-aminobutyrate aminotransferase